MPRRAPRPRRASRCPAALRTCSKAVAGVTVSASALDVHGVLELRHGLVAGGPAYLRLGGRPHSRSLRRCRCRSRSGSWSILQTVACGHPVERSSRNFGHVFTWPGTRETRPPLLRTWPRAAKNCGRTAPSWGQKLHFRPTVLGVERLGRRTTVSRVRGFYTQDGRVPTRTTDMTRQRRRDTTGSSREKEKRKETQSRPNRSVSRI